MRRIALTIIYICVRGCGPLGLAMRDMSDRVYLCARALQSINTLLIWLGVSPSPVGFPATPPLRERCGRDRRRRKEGGRVITLYSRLQPPPPPSAAFTRPDQSFARGYAVEIWFYVCWHARSYVSVILAMFWQKHNFFSYCWHLQNWHCPRGTWFWKALVGPDVFVVAGYLSRFW